MSANLPVDPVLAEYDQINENIRFLADVRFKLLALVPAVGGAAVFILSNIGLRQGAVPDAPPVILPIILLLSVLGSAATLGVTLYDQRNSELYNALIHRAKYLEAQFGARGTPAALKRVSEGGQFAERPPKSRRFIITAGHDIALALIYGPLLGAWLFPIVYALNRLLRGDTHASIIAASCAAFFIAVAATARLIALDTLDKKLYDQSAQLKENAKPGQGSAGPADQPAA
jgi:uncharacterized membrane protein YfcA